MTCIHIPGYGWWYAVTVMDYFGRYLLALHLTPGYAASSIIDGLSSAIAEAHRLHGRLERPPILVTDNGSSFLARRFQAFLAGRMSQVRTRYRTPEQLGLFERFHRTLKEEEIYWNLYSSPADAREKLAFRERYNRVRPHWALLPRTGGDPVTPEEVYRGEVAIGLPRWQKWAREAKKKIEEQLSEGAQEARSPRRWRSVRVTQKTSHIGPKELRAETPPPLRIGESRSLGAARRIEKASTRFDLPDRFGPITTFNGLSGIDTPSGAKERKPLRLIRSKK